MKKRVLSLIQPTGNLHLGNYLGAIQNWVNLQDKYECYYGIADYHSMTMPYQATKLSENTWNLINQLIACGIKIENLFIQSLVPEHTELAWILACSTSAGELLRMTQFKDKGDQNKEQSKDNLVSSGLLFYPILQAADILIYKADFVPIGKDQEQHLELSRNIAQRFNMLFGKNCLQHPEPLFSELPKILSFANPEKKMSKSLGEKHVLELFELPEIVRKKVKSAVTDTGDDTLDTMSPGVMNLFQIAKVLGGDEQYNILMDNWSNGNRHYSLIKEYVGELCVTLTSRLRENLQNIEGKQEQIKEEIIENSAKVRKAASATMQEVRALVGLPPN